MLRRSKKESTWLKLIKFLADIPLRAPIPERNAVLWGGVCAQIVDWSAYLRTPTGSSEERC